MTYQIIDAPQRSPEWFAARCGRLTGSVAADMLATVQKGEAASRRNLRVALVLQQLNNRPEESKFTTAAMQQGIDREPLARARYEAVTGELVTETGFLQCTDLMAGVSLDGCVMRDGRIVLIQEFKAPEQSAHLDVIETGKVPTKYLAQVTHGLWVTGADACDWMSFNPDFPEGLQEVLIRVERDDKAIAAYDAAARAFLEEVSAKVNQLRQRMVA